MVRKRRERVALAIVVLFVGVCFCIGVKNIGGEYASLVEREAKPFTSSVKYAPSNTTVLYNGHVLQNGILSSERSRGMSVIPIGGYYADKKQNMFPSLQSGGAKTLYATSSATVHSYGGGGSTGGGSFNSQSVSRGVSSASNASAVNNIHTFVAMSSPVRNTAEEFEYGENAIGAESPYAVIRRTPGSGPVTDDPGHTPTVVGTTPVGEGLYFMMMLAVCYVVRCLKKSNKEINLQAE